MSTISGGSKPEFTGNEVLQASKLNLATHHWVATEVPDDSVGRDGDIVFVPGNSAPNSELPGIGGWATIEEVSGTFTKHNDGDWVAYEWTDDGNIKTTEGIVDVLVVAGGSGTGDTSGRGWAGGAGKVLRSLMPSSGTVPITVGQYRKTGASNPYDNPGYPSSFGSNSIGSGSGGYIDSSSDGSAGPPPSPGIAGPGLKYDITGTELEYGRGGGNQLNVTHSVPAAGEYGWAASAKSRHGGSDVYVEGTGGVVIVRVPASNAEGVVLTRHGWLNHATVEDNVVVSVTKTPDNQPYKTAVDEVECDPSVQVGYTYDEETNTFVAPKPDYSDEIAALTERLEELRNV